MEAPDLVYQQIGHAFLQITRFPPQILDLVIGGCAGRIACQKHRMRLFIRTVGIARARIKNGLANLVQENSRCSIWNQSPATSKLPVCGTIREDECTASWTLAEATFNFLKGDRVPPDGLVFNLHHALRDADGETIPPGQTS